MTGLGKTVSRLARFLRQQPTPAPTGLPSRLERTVAFGSNPGGLVMFSYVPQQFSGPLPLVVVLHGCSQTAAVYDHGSGWSALADECGFAVLYAEQAVANNPKRCFNWFQPGDTRRESGEVQSIRQMIEQLIVSTRIDRDRIFITGLSAGGAMTAVMLATYPEIFAAGAIIAGLPYGAAGTVKEAFQAMFEGRRRSAQQWGDLVRSASSHRGPWPRISIWHGTADATVIPMNADELVKQWKNVHRLEGGFVSSEAAEGLRRQVWLGPDGKPLIEKYSVSGMGHGAPVDARNGGHAGPFMLDVGISSTYQSALSWGLASPLAVRQSRSEGVTGETLSLSLGAVITNALRTAGLMK